MATATLHQWNGAYATYKGRYVLIKIMVCHARNEETSLISEVATASITERNKAKCLHACIYLEANTLRIVCYRFSPRLTVTLNLCPIYLKLLLHVLYITSGHAILKQIR